MRRRRALRRLHGNTNKQTIVQKRAADESVAEPAELVRKLNTRVREVIELLPHDGNYLLDFYCECGCCDSVRLTIAEYDALKGKPVFRAGHPV
jgi:hypothetical protein